MSHSSTRRPKNAPNEYDLIELSPRLQAALASIEWPDCRCNVSLMSICIVGKEQGCRDRQKREKCNCKRRWLPTCLLKQKHGCRSRRLSKHSRHLIPECRLAHPVGCFAREKIGICECKRVPKPSCNCPLAQMPCCMAAGCPDRQRGHVCDCPRGPAERCRHMSYADQMRMLGAFLTIKQTFEKQFPTWKPYDIWAYLQRMTEKKRYVERDKRYAEPELPGKAADMSDREHAVEIMELRHDCGVSLYHPEDHRSPSGEKERRRQIAQISNLKYFISSCLTPAAKGGVA